MNKNTTLLLILWNVVLSALLGWTLMRSAPVSGDNTSTSSAGTKPAHATVPRDSSALADARIAFFMVDSLRNGLDLLKDNKSTLAGEEGRLQARMDKEMARAQRRSQELMSKDHSYSTKAEVEADEREFRKLENDMRQLAAESEEQLMRLGEKMAVNFSKELQAFLEEYNKTAGYDYIISVEPGGQIWVGNQDLDLTEAVIEGLNDRYRSTRTEKK